MVAVFTGNGLGLYNSSLTQLGLGLGDSAGLGQSRTRQYVNVASGNLVLQDQDESLVVRGLNTTLLRTYNSRGSVAGSGTDGFVTGYERRVALTAGTLNEAGSQMTLSTGDGQDVVFTWSGTLNQYTSTAGEGAHDTLSYEAASRTWTYVEGSTRREEQYADHADTLLQGRLTRIRDLRSDGTTPAQFEVLYDASQRVAEVRALDGSGAMADALVFGYDGSGRLASVTTREGGVVRGQLSYGYDNEGRLSWVQTDLTPADSSDDLWDETMAANNDGHRFRTSYTYAAANDLRLASVTQSDGTVTSYTYEADGAGGYRVKTVTRGDGNSNDADGIGETITFTYSGNQTEVADSLGRAWIYQFDTDRQLTAVLAPPQDGQRDVTTYAYNAAGDVTQVQTVRGATILAQLDYAYDSNGNAIQQWDALGNTIKRSYGSANQLLSETVYTDVDADRTGSGQPTAGLTTNYVYDAQNRLRFVIDVAGDVQEIRYAAAGAGIGQRSAVRQYLGAGYAGTYNESSLAAWTAGQGANSTLTEWSYDAKGRLAQQTAYASVDAAGNGVFDAATGITRYSYDAQGLLLQQIEVRGSGRTLAGTGGPAGSEVTDYVYDGLGRLLSILKRDAATAAGNDSGTVATTYAYLDSAYQLQVIQDSGAVRIETRNTAGRLVSVVDTDQAVAPTITRATQNIYDSAGQLRATQDASGARRYFFYDAKGRLEASVDATGAVTQTRYDGDDRPVQVRQYATRVNTGSWLVNGAVVPAMLADIGVIANNGSDRVQAMTYDAAGRLVVETDGLAASNDRQVTTTAYDGAGRAIQVTVTDAVGTSGTARTTRNFYDNAGRLTGTLDAEGYLVEYVYDRAGRRVQTIGYAGLTAAGNRATGTLAQLRPASDAANDQITRFYYNGRGQAVGRLDAEGYLSETVIDEAGHVRAERRYAAAMTWVATDTLASLRTRAGGNYRESRLAYDGQGYLVTQTDPEGTVTRYSYDDAGRLVRTEAAALTTEVRDSFVRYNVFGEVIGEIGGEQAAQASAALLGGKALNDPTLSEAQRDAAYSQYGVRHSVDALGRRIESIDAQGNKTWLFYDGQGRQTFQVRGLANAAHLANALGEVSETRYDAFGQVTDILIYTGRITLPIAGDRASVEGAIHTLSFVAGLDARRQMTYTARGQLATLVDAEGALSRFTYNAFGERSREELAVGTSVALTIDRGYDRRGLQVTQTETGASVSRSQSQAYDVFGRVISRTDARGTVTTFGYDRLGRQLEQSVTAAGRQETSVLAYDAFDRVLTQTDPLGQSTTYQYNDSQRSVTVTTPEGVMVTTSHNRHGQTSTVAQALPDGSSAITRYTYDRSGALIRTSDPLDQASNNEYDVRGLLVATVDATGYRVELHYDAVGRVLSRVVDPAGLNLVTEYRYDGQGRQVQVIDASGVISTQRYDREGRLLETVQDAGAGRLNLSTLYSYDAQGQQISVTEAAGTAVARTTLTVFDALGRRVSETVDAGAGRLNLSTTYAYDGNDNLIQRTDAAGNVTQYAYDKANRLAYVIDPTGAAVRTWVDAAGRTVMTRAYAQRLDPAAVVDKTVGQIDALLVADEAADLSSYRVYDRDGRLRYTMDALGDVRESIVDVAGRTVGSRTYATAVSIDAGLRGKLMAGTATVGDLAAKLVADDNRDARSLQVFDTAGRLRFSIDALGQVQEQRYDAAGRVTQTLGYANALSTAVLTPATLGALRAGLVSVATVAGWVSGQQASARSTTQVFDGAGRVRYTLTRDSASTVLVSEHRYDALGQPIAEVVYGVAIPSTTPASETAIAAALTAAGGDSAANQRLTQYVYDAEGRLRYTIDNLNLVTEQRYDALGQVSETRSYTAAVAAGTAITLADLAAATAGLASRSTKYAYDAAGRRTQVTDALNHTEITTYDALGQRTSLTNRLGYTWNYSYDAAGRLVTETTPAVAVARYDATGHLFLSTERVVTRLGYDAFGNVVSRTESDGTAEARTTQYAYDLRGNQVRTIFPRAGAYSEATGTLDTSVGINPETQITYDALDRAVVQKDTNGNFSYKVYDRQGQLAYDIDAEGFVTGYTYSAYGEQIGLTRYAARLDTGAPAFAGWQAGQAIGLVPLQAALVTGAADRTVTTTYDARGLSLSVTQAAVGYVTAAGVDSIGAPRTEFTYDRFGQRVKTAVLIEGTPGQASAVWANTYTYYDALGRQIRTVDAEGYVTAFEYDALGQLTQQVEYARALPTGGLSVASVPALPEPGDDITGHDRVTRYRYDVLGRKTSETSFHQYQNADGFGGIGQVTTTYQFDAAGQVVDVVIDGNHTRTGFDALGRSISIIEPQRLATVADAEQQLAGSTAVTLASESLYQMRSPYTELVYDAFGNVVQVTRFAAGLMDGETPNYFDARNQVSLTLYDRQGRAVMTQNAEGDRVSTRYDAADNVLEVASTLSGSDAAHNAIVRTTYTYDKTGRQMSSRSERNVAATGIVVDAEEAVAYNSFGEVVAKGFRASDLLDPSKSAQYEYNVSGLLIRSNADNGVFYTYGYNLAGQQTQELRPAIMGVDASGNPVHGTSVYRYENDRLGRQLHSVLPSNSTSSQASAVIKKRYDRWGNVLEVIDPRGYVTGYQYNDRDQLVREIKPIAKVVSDTGVETWQHLEQQWRYDMLGRLVATQDANGIVRSYRYDAVGQQVISIDGTGAASRQAYDVLGRQRFSQNVMGYIRYQDYDRMDRVAGHGDFLLDNAGSSRTQTALETYRLDENGDRVIIVDGVGNTVRYDYDSRKNVIRSTTQTGVSMRYGYDAAGNKVLESDLIGGSKTWTFDYFGRVIAHIDLGGKAASYQYDSTTGQLLSESNGWGDLARYQYYANGQVRRIDHTDGSYSAYQYDASGNRIEELSQSVDGGGVAIQIRTRMVYDSVQRLERITSDDMIAGIRTLDMSYGYDAVGNRRYVAAQSAYGPGAAPISQADQGPYVIGVPASRNLVGGDAIEWRWRGNDYLRDPEGQPLIYTVEMGEGAAQPAWLTISTDALTGELVFRTTASSLQAIGQTFNLRLVAQDTAGNTAAVSTQLKVTANTAPELSQPGSLILIGTTTVEINREILIAGLFMDMDMSDTLQFSLVGNIPAWLNAGTRGGYLLLQGTPPADAYGKYQFKLRATDQHGASVEKNVELQIFVKAASGSVDGTPAPQQAYPLAPSEAAVGSPWSFTIPNDAFVSDNEPLAFQVQGMPAWLNYDPVTRTFSGVPIQAGQWTITVLVSTADGKATTFSAMVINARDVVTPIPDMRAKSYEPWTYQVPETTFLAQPGETFVYRAEQIITVPESVDANGQPVAAHDEAHGLPDWLSFDPSTRTFSGTPYSSVVRIRVSVVGTMGRIASDEFTLTAASYVPPTAIKTTSEIETYPSSAYKFVYKPSAFTFSASEPLTYSASDLPYWLQFDPATNTFSGWAQARGHWTITLTATDAYGASASAKIVVTVLNTAPIITLPENYYVRGTQFEPFVKPFYLAVDQNAEFLTYSFSDLPPGIVYDRKIHALTGIPTEAGTYTVTWTVSDGLLSTSDQFEFFVDAYIPENPAPKIIGVIPDQIAEATRHDAPWSYTLPGNIFSDADSLLISAAGMPSWLSFDHTSNTFNGWPHEAGSWLITVTARDTAQQAISTTFVITTPNAPPEAASNPYIPQLPLNQPWSLGIASHFSDPNGQAVNIVVSNLPDWMHFDPVALTLSGTPTRYGNWPITITVTDALGLASVFTWKIGTTNNPPTVAYPIPDQSGYVGVDWTYTVPANTFADIDEAEVLTYSAKQAIWNPPATDANGVLQPGYYSYDYLPSLMSFDAATRTFTLRAKPSQTSYTLAVFANDGRGGQVSDIFTLSILDRSPYVNVPISDQVIETGKLWDFTIPSNTFIDPEGRVLTYSTKLTSNNPGAYWSWLAISGNRFKGVPPAFTAGTTLTYRVTVTDQVGNKTYDDFSIHIVAPGSSLLAGPPADESSALFQSESITDEGTSSMSFAAGSSAALAGEGAGTSPNIQKLWFTYDAENRVQVVNGVLSNGMIIIGGDHSYSQQYNAAGYATVQLTSRDGAIQRTQSVYTERGELQEQYFTVPLESSSRIKQVAYRYDNAGHTIETREYFAPGETISVRIGPLHNNPAEPGEPPYLINVSGWLKHAEQYIYDADGRIQRIDEFGRAQNWGRIITEGTDSDPVVIAHQSNDLSALSQLSEVLYTDAMGASGYDAAGRLRTYRYHHLASVFGTSEYTQTYVYSYQAREEYLESSVSGTSTDSTYRATTSASSYDAVGRRVSVVETTPLKDYRQTLTRMRYFGYDAEGHILSRRDGTLENGLFTQTVNDPVNPVPTQVTAEQWASYTLDQKKALAAQDLNQHFVYAAGQQVARLTEAGSLDASTQLTAFDSSELGSSGVLVQEGDTLQSLAQRVYGTSSLWYVLAEANAASDLDLVAGMTLKAPEVKTSQNDAGTFKPYNPAEIVGPTTPTLPHIEAAPKQGCNVLATLIVVAVTAVVVSFAPELATTLTPYFSGAAITTGIFAGSNMAAIMAAGFATGFAGSVASQVVGKAVGVVDHFSLRSAVGSGLTNAMTAGIGAKLGGSTAELIEHEASFGAIAKSAVLTAGAGAVGNRLAGVSGAAFSWKAIAASAVSNIVAAGIGHELDVKAPNLFGDAGSFSNNFANGMIGGIVSVHTRRQFGFNDRIDYGNIVADAFGNALGNSVANTIKDQRLRKQQELATQLNDRALAISTEAQSRLDEALQARNEGIDQYLQDRLADGLQTQLGESQETFQNSLTAVMNQQSAEVLTALTREAAMRKTGSERAKAVQARTPQEVRIVPSLGRGDAIGGAGKKVSGRGSGQLNLDPDFLSELRNPSVQSNPEMLRSLFQSTSRYSHSLLENLNPEERSLATSLIYSKVFKNDPTAVWFGMAPYATAKVGETYDLLTPFVLLGSDNAQIIEQGLFEGNGAVLESMLTAELIYRAGGTDAVRAIARLDDDMFGARFSSDNIDSKNSLVRSFELRDQAKAALVSGDQQKAMLFLSQSVIQSANFEQRMVLQQYYDRPYTVDGTRATLGTAINDFLRLDYTGMQGIPFKNEYNQAVQLLSNTMTRVTIGGQNYAFSGTNLNDPDQRLSFISRLSDGFMQMYQTPTKQLTGPERIHSDHMHHIVNEYSSDLLSRLRARYGIY